MNTALAEPTWFNFLMAITVVVIETYSWGHLESFINNKKVGYAVWFTKLIFGAGLGLIAFLYPEVIAGFLMVPIFIIALTSSGTMNVNGKVLVIPGLSPSACIACLLLKNKYIDAKKEDGNELAH